MNTLTYLLSDLAFAALSPDRQVMPIDPDFFGPVVKRALEAARADHDADCDIDPVLVAIDIVPDCLHPDPVTRRIVRGELRLFVMVTVCYSSNGWLADYGFDCIESDDLTPCLWAD